MLLHRRGGQLVRGRAALLPVLSPKDWRDIDWAISARVDFVAVSFVRSADVITNLRSYIQTRIFAADANSAGGGGGGDAAGVLGRQSRGGWCHDVFSVE
jgi:Pyruvate kinase, barrel domain